VARDATAGGNVGVFLNRRYAVGEDASAFRTLADYDARAVAVDPQYGIWVVRFGTEEFA
jgi:hypothetical protein